MPINEEVKIPEENRDNIWMTVLVLLWLEICCEKDKSSWKFVHKKGYEWLKMNKVNYEEIKQFGVSLIITNKSQLVYQTTKKF